MRDTIIQYLLTLITSLVMLGGGEAVAQDGFYHEWSVGQLERRLMEIDGELEELASLSFRSGVGAIGYRSNTHETSDELETIQIDLGKIQTIEEIILVPCIWRDSKRGFLGDGFPVEFRVIAGSEENPAGTVVASVRKEDKVLPRIAPLVISCGGIRASWVRIEADVLTQRAWDKKYILQLAEILVFDEHENVALRMPVEASSPVLYEGGARAKEYLVDGFLPYLMDAATGEQSIAYVSKVGIGEQPEIVIDLGESYPLSRIRLHAIDVSDTVPQAVPDDYGMPRKLLVEGANEKDFSDSVKLTEYIMETIQDAGPVVMRGFPETSCRYVRLTAIEPFKSIEMLGSDSQIGFAEIELISNGVNVARGAGVEVDFGKLSPGRALGALTDGRNLYGDILYFRDWLNELAKRHELEVERPLIVAELDQHYARQKRNFNYMLWLVAFLIIGMIIAMLIGRMVRMRHVSNIRLRLAADLHDELGANMHTIGLLSDLASETDDDPEELATLHRRIRSETERSGIAVRHCTNMLEAEGLYTDMKEDMARASRRIMAKLEHDIVIEGEAHLGRLTQQTRIDLYLFFKECLVNISKHSGATEFKTRLIADRKQVLLSISDNGRGVDEGERIPKSLKRRAKLLRAALHVETPESGGTSITLTLPVRSYGFRRNKQL
ncbi:MAG: histidine kinase [Akkermansiaceae bacterium]